MAHLWRVAPCHRLWLARAIGTDCFRSRCRPDRSEGLLRRYERPDRAVAGALSARFRHRTARHWLVLSATAFPAPFAAQPNCGLGKTTATFTRPTATGQLSRAVREFLIFPSIFNWTA